MGVLEHWFHSSQQTPPEEEIAQKVQLSINHVGKIACLSSKNMFYTFQFFHNNPQQIQHFGARGVMVYKILTGTVITSTLAKNH